MTTTKLPDDFRIPFDRDAIISGDPVKLTEYLLELAEFLQMLLQSITDAANLTVDLMDGDAIYSKAKLTDGSYPIGTWRLKQVGNNWQRQVQLTLGTWTVAGDFEVPV